CLDHLSASLHYSSYFFFFQAEDGIRDFHVTGVQTCALPIWTLASVQDGNRCRGPARWTPFCLLLLLLYPRAECVDVLRVVLVAQIGRASCRERVYIAVVGVSVQKQSTIT